MSTVVAIPAGVVLAFLLITVARRRADRLYPYAVGLIVAAMIYVAFAVVGEASWRWIAIEVAGLIAFGAAAFCGLRYLAVLLAVGWSAHVLWDVLLHLEGPGAAYTPRWYPWLCVSFDLVIAVAVLVSARESGNKAVGRSA